MGQKTHPIGLRVGINRKWNTTWFAEGGAYKTSFFAQHQVEQFFKSFFYFYSSTKNSKTKRVWLVDIKWFRSGLHQLYIFVFFYKFRTRKRKPNIRRRMKMKVWGIMLRKRMLRKRLKNKIAVSRLSSTQLQPKEVDGVSPKASNSDENKKGPIRGGKSMYEASKKNIKDPKSESETEKEEDQFLSSYKIETESELKIFENI